jgi:imidazolonepropionase-like amidohydrolase
MRRLFLLFWVLCFIAGPARAADSPVEYVLAGKLLDVRSGKVLNNQVIVIHGDRVERVAAASEVNIPAGATVTDLSHATVLPGLIDAHTHTFLTLETPIGRYDEQLLKESWQYRTIEAVVNVKLDLEAGFTTLRDVGNEGAMYSDVDVRNAINRGLIPGPRMQVATRAISVTGGYPLTGYSPEVTVTKGVQIIDGPIEGRKAVREQISYGADLIKIYSTQEDSGFDASKPPRPAGEEMWRQPLLTLEEVNAIVDEAHRAGVRVACHSYVDPGLRNCLDAGVNSIEHGIVLNDADIATMVAKGIYLVPTLDLTMYELVLPEVVPLHEVSFKKALASGVKIAFGTDVGAFKHGTQAFEFEYMVKYGMSPLQAIQSATLGGADLMGWSDRVGEIAPKKFADIIAVQGNPLDDIKQLEHVKFVMKGGQVVRNDFVK